jgi:hypothetical protein
MIIVQIVVTLFWAAMYLLWTIYSIIDLIRNWNNPKPATIAWVALHIVLFIMGIIVFSTAAIVNTMKL